MAKDWTDFVQKIRKVVYSLRQALAGLFLLLGIIAEILMRTGLAHSVGYWMLVVLSSVLAALGVIILVLSLVASVMSGLSWLSRTSTRSAHGLLVAGAIVFTTGFTVLLAATWIHT
jgi:hypothetical protein